MINEPMTKEERILALDAAVCAAEGAGVPTEIIGPLWKWLGHYMDRHYPTFGECCKAQKRAVEKLAKSPEAFGAE